MTQVVEKIEIPVHIVHRLISEYLVSEGTYFTRYTLKDSKRNLVRSDEHTYTFIKEYTEWEINLIFP